MNDRSMLDLEASNNTLSATVWLLAHDSQISDLVKLISERADILQRYRLASALSVSSVCYRCPSLASTDSRPHSCYRA
jgi:hypothetical protein